MWSMLVSLLFGAPDFYTQRYIHSRMLKSYSKAFSSICVTYFRDFSTGFCGKACGKDGFGGYKFLKNLDF